LNSPAFVALDACSVKLFLDLRVKLNGSNNGNINATLSELKHHGWRSSATLTKSIKQLESAGFIAKTRTSIGVCNGSKVCNLYRFTDLDCFEVPKLQITACKATNDFTRFTSLNSAVEAVSVTVPREPRPKKERRIASKTEALNISEIATQPLHSAALSRYWAQKRFGKNRVHPTAVH